VVAVGFAIYHFSLIRTRERERCFRAFQHNQWVGLAVFVGVVGTYFVK
jgi:4-hydroxybenzoate polyprenyltransferase